MHRHPHHAGRRRGHGGADLLRRPRRVPAGHRHRSPCSTPSRASPSCARMTPAAVEAKYGVPPERYSDLAALVGESSDNLPGVPGVGPKTAAKWIGQYGDLTGVVAHVDEIKGKAGESLREHLDGVLRNRRLNQLVRDLELPVGIADLERAELGPRAGAPGLRQPGVPGAARPALRVPRRRRRRRPSAASTSTARCSPPDEVAGWLDGACRAGRHRGRARRRASGAAAPATPRPLALATDGDAAAYVDLTTLDPAGRGGASAPGWPTPSGPRCCTTPRGRCWRWPRAGWPLRGHRDRHRAGGLPRAARPALLRPGRPRAAPPRPRAAGRGGRLRPGAARLRRRGRRRRRRTRWCGPARCSTWPASLAEQLEATGGTSLLAGRRAAARSGAGRHGAHRHRRRRRRC